jgi:hypothetical protein
MRIWAEEVRATSESRTTNISKQTSYSFSSVLRMLCHHTDQTPYSAACNNGAWALRGWSSGSSSIDTSKLRPTHGNTASGTCPPRSHERFSYWPTWLVSIATIQQSGRFNFGSLSTSSIEAPVPLQCRRLPFVLSMHNHESLETPRCFNPLLNILEPRIQRMEGKISMVL